MPDRDQVEGSSVRWQPKYLLDLLVVKSSDGHGAEIQGHSLQQEILCGVARF
jgi:hypothetical protein